MDVSGYSTRVIETTLKRWTSQDTYGDTAEENMSQDTLSGTETQLRRECLKILTQGVETLLNRGLPQVTSIRVGETAE